MTAGSTAEADFAPGARSGGLPWTVRDVLRLRTVQAMFALSLVVRLIYGAWVHVPPHDDVVYDGYAHSLLTTGTYAWPGDGGHPIRAPGYPFLLAAIYWLAGERHWAVQLVQYAFEMVTALLVLSLAQRLRFPRGVAIGSTALVLFYPFTMAVSTLIASETLTTLLVTFGVWSLVVALQRPSPLPAVGFGVAFSLAALVRPSFAFLPAVLLLAVMISRRIPLRPWLRLGATSLVAFVLVWAPWGARNALTLDHFVPYHDGYMRRPGYNLWLNTWVTNMQDIYMAVWESPARPPDKAFVSDTERTEVTTLLARRETLELKSPGDEELSTIDNRFSELAKERIQHHRFRYFVVNPMLRCFTMWFASNLTFMAQRNVPLSEFRSAIHERPIALTIKVFSLMLSVAFPLLALIGWWLARRDVGVFADLPVLAGAYCSIIIQFVMITRPSFQIWMEPRYVMETFPLLTLLVTVGALATWSAFTRGPGRRPEPAALEHSS